MLGYNYQRFAGWRFFALLAVFGVYTIWFVGPGPFGDLTRIEGYSPLQTRGFYTGAEAVGALESLSTEARRIKFTALGFDLIYMVLQMWVFEAIIAFGLSSLGLMASRWRWLLLAPVGFLLFDFLENGFLALTWVTSSETIGGLAGIFTLLKFAIFIPLAFASIGLGLAAIVSKILRNRKGGHQPN